MKKSDASLVPQRRPPPYLVLHAVKSPHPSAPPSSSVPPSSFCLHASAPRGRSGGGGGGDLANAAVAQGRMGAGPTFHLRWRLEDAGGQRRRTEPGMVGRVTVAACRVLVVLNRVPSSLSAASTPLALLQSSCPLPRRRSSGQQPWRVALGGGRQVGARGEVSGRRFPAPSPALVAAPPPAG
jgi:hypothetical protein